MTNHESRITLDVEGDQATNRAKAMLNAIELNGEVHRVQVVIEEQPTEDTDEAAEPQGQTDETLDEAADEQDVEVETTTKEVVEDTDEKTIERAKDDIQQNTLHHAVLQNVAGMDQPVSVQQIGDDMGLENRDSISPTMTVLYRRKLLDRVKRGSTYYYELTDWGRRTLEDLGPVDIEQADAVVLDDADIHGPTDGDADGDIAA